MNELFTNVIVAAGSTAIVIIFLFIVRYFFQFLRRLSIRFSTMRIYRKNKRLTKKNNPTN